MYSNDHRPKGEIRPGDEYDDRPNRQPERRVVNDVMSEDTQITIESLMKKLDKPQIKSKAKDNESLKSDELIENKIIGNC